MNMRHFLFMVVCIGLFAFSPNLASAGKNGEVGVPHSPVSSQSSVKKIKSSKSEKIGPSVAFNKGRKSKGRVIQTNGNKEKPRKIEPKVSKPLKQMKRRVTKEVRPREKKHNAENVKVKGKEERVKEHPDTKTPAKVQSVRHLNPPRANEDKKRPLYVLKKKSKLMADEKPSSKRRNSTQNHSMPHKQRGIPIDSETMFQPLEQTLSPRGQSSEQVHFIGGKHSFFPFRADWNFWLHQNLPHRYSVRNCRFSHQWIHAPPSLPPKTAPFFLA